MHWKNRQRIRLASGILLLLIAGYGIVYAARVATAQWEYKRLKYGYYTDTRSEIPPPKDIRQFLSTCERIYNLYPHNYYCFVLVADKAFTAAYDAKEFKEYQRYMRSAEYWDDIALRTNPYNSEVCYTHVRILQENGGMYDAIDFWRDVVLEREFWNPDRHEVMAQLYLRAKMTSMAIEELPWLPYGATRNKVLALQRARAKVDRELEP